MEKISLLILSKDFELIPPTSSLIESTLSSTFALRSSDSEIKRSFNFPKLESTLFSLLKRSFLYCNASTLKKLFTFSAKDEKSFLILKIDFVFKVSIPSSTLAILSLT